MTNTTAVPQPEDNWEREVYQQKMEQKALSILDNNIISGNPLFIATLAALPGVQRNNSKSESEANIAAKAVCLAKKIIATVKQEK